MVPATYRPAETMIPTIVWNGLLIRRITGTLPAVTGFAPTIKGQTGIVPAEISPIIAFTILLALRCRLPASAPQALVATVVITKAQA